MVYFFGKGYSSDRMVKLCIINNAINSKNVVSTYMLDSVSLWHSRLSHIDISTMKRLVKCGVLIEILMSSTNVKFALNLNLLDSHFIP